MSNLSADILIVGSGLAAVTVARSALNTGKTVLMIEAGGEIPMGESRRWQDFIMKDLINRQNIIMLKEPGRLSGRVKRH